MTYEEFKEKVGSVILTDEGNCPVTPVVQMLQGKWKLQILYELCIKCPMRFGERRIDQRAERIRSGRVGAAHPIQRDASAGGIFPY